jgi:nucleoside-diphosphate-sugar epimerase
MQQIALTGATGFVGRAVLDRLLDRGHRVKTLLRTGRSLPARTGLETVAGTLQDEPALQSLVSGCQAVIHVAGAISGFDYADFAATNVHGTERLVRAAERCAPNARLIHVSSLAAREPGLSAYAASKRDGESVVKSSKLHWSIIRPPAVYGPDDPAMRPLWQALARGWLPRTGPADARFSLLHVDDLASALLALSETADFERELFCLHDGHERGYGWNDLAAIAGQARGRPVRIFGLTHCLLAATARANWLAARISGRRPAVLLPGKLPELAHSDWVCDNTQLPGCPNWTPRMKLQDCLTDLPGWSHQR